MRTVQTRTLPVFAGARERALSFTDITVMLVRMTAAQVRAWNWVGEEWDGTAPVEGWEIRDTTGALLGVVLPLGHMARHMHAEYYDPQAGDFFPAGETEAVLTQALARVLDARGRNAGPVPAGEGFDLEEPRYLPVRGACWARVCPEGCPECEADYQRQEAARLAWRAAA